MRSRSTASSFAGNLIAGHRFSLSGHFDGDGPYVLTEVEHSASLPDPGSGRLSYSNTFRCSPGSLPYRPRRVTPIPAAAATETAVVVGPPGEEIYTDAQGRIKVQFHWDREGRHDENSSCWIRVVRPVGQAAARRAADRPGGRDRVRGWRSRSPDRDWSTLALTGGG